jgi:hypothetical protein
MFDNPGKSNTFLHEIHIKKLIDYCIYTSSMRCIVHSVPVDMANSSFNLEPFGWLHNFVTFGRVLASLPSW